MTGGVANAVRATVATRLEIGFADERADWCHAPAQFTAGELRIAGHPVMEDWEDGYMATLAEIAGGHGGRILELGYGLGISSRHLRSNPAVTEYWVVECHPEVIERAVVEMKDDLASGRAHLISGFWEDAVPILGDGGFDGILFDTYPLTADEIHGNHFPFFPHARRLLANGGTFTYYSDEVEGLSQSHMEHLGIAGFGDIGWKVVEVNPPVNCEYWRHNTIVAPIVRL